MDQNYQADFFYQEEQPVKNAAYYRKQAREALKGKWTMASVACFLFLLITFAICTVSIIPTYAYLIVKTIAFGSLPEQTLVPAVLFAYVGIILIGILLLPPIAIGLCRIFLDLIDGKPIKLETLFSYFKKGYLSSVTTALLYFLLVIAAILPMVLFIIVGVIVGGFGTVFAELLAWIILLIGYVFTIILSILLTYRLSLVPFILAEYPTISALDALRNSTLLMQGNKWKYFCLQISFIGWILLLIPVTILTCGIGAMIGEFLLYAYMFTAQAAFYHNVAKRDAANDVEFPSLDPNDYNLEEDPNRPF